MATLTPIQTSISRNSQQRWAVSGPGFSAAPMPAASRVLSWNTSQRKSKNKRSLTVVAAVGDVLADGTTYLSAGAAAVALLGTAFPILLSRKDLAGFLYASAFFFGSGLGQYSNSQRLNFESFLH